MPRLTKIYTKTGDDGTTGLAGGRRVPKDSLRVETYGTVDELNACLGAALASGLEPSLAADLERIQQEIFHLGAELATPGASGEDDAGPRIEPRHVLALEERMDALNERLGPLENFILPGGSPGAAHLHLARVVCRRAERLAVALSRKEAIGAEAVRYLNRLSDALFVMARAENLYRGRPDVLWDSRG